MFSSLAAYRTVVIKGLAGVELGSGVVQCACHSAPSPESKKAGVRGPPFGGSPTMRNCLQVTE